MREGFSPPAQSFDKNDWDFRRKYFVIAWRRCNFVLTKLPGGVNPSPTTQRNNSSTNWNLAYNPFQMMFKAFLRSDFQAGTILTNLLNPSLLRPTVLHTCICCVECIMSRNSRKPFVIHLNFKT